MRGTVARRAASRGRIYQRMPKPDGLPVPALRLLLLAGLSALGIALASALFAVGIDGRPDDVIIEFGGHRAGGPTDTLIAVLLALVVGTVGVVCVLRYWRELTERQRNR